MLNLLKKQIFKNNHYSGSFLDPENWWCILAQFEKFEQIWGTVKAGLLNQKKYLKIPCFAFHLSTYMYPTCKISKKCIPAKLPLVQNWGQMVHLRQPTTKASFENFIYMTLLSVMTLHCHRLYQISSLEANLSSEDMK